jgi:hypothetical protein
MITLIVCIFVQHSIVSVETATPEALDQAKSYYCDVEFAAQLCVEFAAAESNPNMKSHLIEAHKMLELIVAHNALLKSSPLVRQPAWPLHEALIRFDMSLQRLTTQYLVTKQWKPRFFLLRGSRLYYSNGKKGHSDSLEGTLAFMMSNPTPDGHCCINLKGAHAHFAAIVIGPCVHMCLTRVQAVV